MNRFEFKSALAVDDAGTITGIAWPFGSPDMAGDIITKGAFTTATTPLPMLYGHNPDDAVGVWESIEETSAGLEVKGRLLIDDVPRAREVRALLAAGALSGLSIGFSAKAATRRKGSLGRIISAVDLVEVSLVSVPSHPRARVTSAKSGADAIAIADAINRATRAFQ